MYRFLERLKKEGKINQVKNQSSRSLYSELTEEANSKGELFPGDGILTLATRLEKVALIQELLANGHDPDERGASDMTALHLSTWQRHLELTQLLLQYGAAVNAVDADKESPLYSAVSGNDNLQPLYKNRPLLPIVELLLDHGARPDQFSILYLTPLRITQDQAVKELLARAERAWYQKNRNPPPVDLGWIIQYSSPQIEWLAKDNQQKRLYLPQFLSNPKKETDREEDHEVQFQTGLKYSQGRGCEQNDEKAAFWYTKAANQDHALAAYNLGIMCLQGRISGGSEEQAFRWFLKSANLGYSDAQFNLANAYRDGDGVQVNHAEAVRWYKRAADQDNEDATFSLAYMYMKGFGCAQNGQEAARLFKELAFHGNHEAMNALGVMFANGDGIKRDFVEAYSWFSFAYQSGHEGASRALEQLRQRLPVEITELIDQKIASAVL